MAVPTRPSTKGDGRWRDRQGTSLAARLAVMFLVVTSHIANAEDDKQPFFRWMDNSVAVLPYGWKYKVDPSDQTTLTFEHAHASAIGDFFGFIDLNKFQNSRDGEDFTYYLELSPRLSVGKILDKDLSFSLLRRGLFEFKDVLLAAQYERGEHDDEAQAANIGIGFDLDAREAGILGLLGKFQYIQLNLYARANLAKHVDHGLRDMQVTMVAGYPLVIGRTRFLIDGYFDWPLGIGSEEWSYHFNPQVKLDLGNFWHWAEKLYAGVELDFWWNKYEIPNTPSFDTNQQAVSLLVKYHI
jgi:nucleoside-specific outer membrane channel protein Tsx